MPLDLRSELPVGALNVPDLERIVERVVRRVLSERDTDSLVDDAGAAEALGIEGPTPRHRARSFRARLERGSLGNLAERAIGSGRARRWRLSDLRAWSEGAHQAGGGRR